MSSWMTRRATRKFRDLGEVTVRMRRCLLSSHIYLRRLNGPVILRLFFSPGYEDLCIKILDSTQIFNLIYLEFLFTR